MEFERKFIDTIQTDEWLIETDTGWSEILAIGKTIEYDEWYLKTENCELICADTHIVFNLDHSMKIAKEKWPLKEIFVKDLKIGDIIQTRNGLEFVLDVHKTDKNQICLTSS